MVGSVSISVGFVVRGVMLGRVGALPSTGLVICGGGSSFCVVVAVSLPCLLCFCAVRICRILGVVVCHRG